MPIIIVQSETPTLKAARTLNTAFLSPLKALAPAPIPNAANGAVHPVSQVVGARPVAAKMSGLAFYTPFFFLLSNRIDMTSGTVSERFACRLQRARVATRGTGALAPGTG